MRHLLLLASACASSVLISRCPACCACHSSAFLSSTARYAIRARRKSVSEKDFIESVNKVVKGYRKFSSTPKYMVYN